MVLCDGVVLLRLYLVLLLGVARTGCFAAVASRSPIQAEAKASAVWQAKRPKAKFLSTPTYRVPHNKTATPADLEGSIFHSKEKDNVSKVGIEVTSVPGKLFVWKPGRFSELNRGKYAGATARKPAYGVETTHNARRGALHHVRAGSR